ncbi:MAG: AI-2E family transporter [Lachnospiraceae bacterium]
MQRKWYEQKGMVLLLLTGAVYFFLRYLSPLLTPILAAGILLTLCYPAFDDLQKRTKIKKQYMAGALLILLCAVLMGLLWWASAYLFKKLPVWTAGLNGLQDKLQVLLTNCCNQVGYLFHMETGELTDTLMTQMDLWMDGIRNSLLSGIVGNSWNYLKGVISLFAVLAVTMIATILLARDYDALLAMVGKQKWSMVMLEVALKVIRYLATYVKAQCLIMVCISFTCVTTLSIAGIPGSVYLGITAGILDALPFIGTGIILVPLTLWQLLSGAWVKAIFCALAYGLCALLREFLEPKLIGRQVGVYPFIILISVYAGIRLFGLWGIIKGPVGMVMIWQSYGCICRYIDNKKPDAL